MDFNISKCKILQITTNHNKSSFTYKMSDTPLDVVLEHNYLGICLHHKLSWEPHINYICTKANRLLGFLKRNLQYAPIEIKEHIYKQLLLPSLEYCSAIWDPHHQTSITKLEMIQHHAAHFVLNRPWYRSIHNYDSITEMLAYLKWPSLQTRRTIARLTLLFKIVKNLLAIYLIIAYHHQPQFLSLVLSIHSNFNSYNQELTFTSISFYPERSYNGTA